VLAPLLAELIIFDIPKSPILITPSFVRKMLAVFKSLKRKHNKINWKVTWYFPTSNHYKNRTWVNFCHFIQYLKLKKKYPFWQWYWRIRPKTKTIIFLQEIDPKWQKETVINMGRVWIPFTGLTQPHFCTCLKPGTWITKGKLHCLFCVQQFEVRGGCLFCWYWGNFLPFSFLNFS